MPIRTYIFQRAILARKVGETNVVFGVQSRFISRYVHARVQVSVCSGYDLCNPDQHPDTRTHCRQHYDEL